MRPAALSDFVGQEELLGEGKFLSSVLSARPLPSLIFWGPPGSGKTTLARILAVETNAVFLPYSAVLSGIKEIREALAELKRTRAVGGPEAARPAILFIDEIHRWNKAQQDALLPFVEEAPSPCSGRPRRTRPSRSGTRSFPAAACWSFPPCCLPTSKRSSVGR